MQAVKTYKQTWNRYDQIRDIALEETHDRLRPVMKGKEGAVNKCEISLSGLDFQTFEKLAKWEDQGKRVASWDWREVRKSYRTHPKRFELAIWHKKLFLAGASIGRPTWSSSKLRLDFIEANLTRSPLTGLITDIVILSAEVYARAIGADQIRIMHPVNDAVKKHYLSKADFAFNSKGNFCFRDL